MPNVLKPSENSSKYSAEYSDSFSERAKFGKLAQNI